MSEPLQDLTAFQRDLLTVVAALEAPNGQDVQKKLATYYDGTLNSGRLYPNLNELADRGLVEKTKKSRTENSYAVTDAGSDALASDLEWRVGLLES